MAQLPPKIPNMTPNWPDFSQQRIHSIASLAPATTTTTPQNPSWADEFLDFSSTKRGTHRRSLSDSIAFLEAPMVEECRNSAVPQHGASNEFDRPQHGASNEFDRFVDEQFMSMFTDEMSMAVAANLSSSNPSTPSNHNSINEEKHTPTDHHHHQQLLPKNESEEVQSSCKWDSQVISHVTTTTTNTSNDRIIDPKRVKRILANRQSAQRSRVRKLQYISELERSVNSLQTEVSVLSPRVAFQDHQRLLLNVDNSNLKQRIAALEQDKIFKDAHQEALKREIERLRQLYHQQNLKKMENTTPSSSSPPPPPSSASVATKGSQEKEQLINI